MNSTWIKAAQVAFLVLGLLPEGIAVVFFEHHPKVAKRLNVAGISFLLGLALWEGIGVIVDAPRHLSDRDKQAVGECLRSASGQPFVLSRGTDRESQVYAGDLDDALRRGGWTNAFLLEIGTMPDELTVAIDPGDDDPANRAKINATLLRACLEQKGVRSLFSTSSEYGHISPHVLLVVPSHP